MDRSSRFRFTSGLVTLLIVLAWVPVTVTSSPDTLDLILESQVDEDWRQYHSYNEIVSGLLSLESSGIAKVVGIGETFEGRTIWAIKISDEPNIDDEQENEVLFVGLHHAREWISAEVPYYLAMKLVEEYSVNSTVKNLIDNSELWIVPVINPDGLEYSRSQVHDLESENNNSRFWRKNRAHNGDGSHGVDLNRNYGTTTWGEDIAEGCWDGCDHPDHEPYWGHSAF
ncbi:MAG: M14 family zinc carboxypeptidase, partial [Candidatus Thorarchaeota archaeon]